jgi:hypothetical protein
VVDGRLVLARARTRGGIASSVGWHLLLRVSRQKFLPVSITRLPPRFLNRMEMLRSRRQARGMGVCKGVDDHLSGMLGCEPRGVGIGKELRAT